MSIQFSNTTNNSGLIQDCEFWLFGNSYGSISDNTELLQTFTNLINRGLDTATVKMFQSDGSWSYDDKNYTSSPEYTQNLADGTALYSLPTNHLILKGVYVKDNNGDYYPLRQITEQYINSLGVSPDEFYDQSGYPEYYELNGDSIKLYPAPNASDVTVDDGLKTTFKRNSEYFSTTDTTKTSGLPDTFQRLTSLYACRDYAAAHNLNKLNAILLEIQRQESDLQDHMSKRSSFKKPIMTMRRKDAK